MGCIRMPCGHGIPADTLLGYADSQIKAGHEMVCCPRIVDSEDANHRNHSSTSQCGASWPWPLIRFVLTQCSTSNEMDSDKLLALGVRCAWNSLRQHFGTSSCPQCQHTLYRQRPQLTRDADSQFVSVAAQCPQCRVAFCWSCGGRRSAKGECECNGFEREVFAILRECETKSIMDVRDVPSVRACPDCSQLIGHTEACKHVKCTRCRTDFCFVCLKKKKDGKWQCGSYRAHCAVAERQSSRSMAEGTNADEWFSLL